MYNKRPKRRKDKYNPYTLSMENQRYYISIMNEVERHSEYSELTEETLNRRGVHKSKTEF